MELKFDTRIDFLLSIKSSNRTFMELKFNAMT